MNIARTIADTRRAVAEARKSGKRIGLVPTMGYLHEGHLSLIDEARSSGADFIVVSIFVNPTQFGPHEDFDRYPRNEERDRALLEEHNVELLFAPTVDEIYPESFSTKVIVRGVSEPLEGERRPGHFDGVATVVLKLFNIVQPDLAVFGQKDAQQCAVIRRMVRDLDIPVELHFGETVREDSGLAMSSRNAYLSETEREMAPALQKALLAGESFIAGDDFDPSRIEEAMKATLPGGVEIDYLKVVDSETFLPPRDKDRDLLLVGAIKIGRTRLIDNRRVGKDSSEREPK